MGLETPTPTEVQNTPKPIEEPKSAKKPVKEIVSGVREKLSSEIRHRTLQVKEYFGKLDQEEFDKLLSFDFRTHLKENPPIGDIFSPQEELANLRSLPKENRREALDIFKQKLAAQRKAWGQCRRFIERSIEFNHDAPKNQLVEWVNQFGSNYGFTEEQKQIAEQLIDGYYEMRQRVLEARQKQPDNIALIEELTGVNLAKSDDVRVSVGPMSIEIEVNPFNCGRLYEKSDNPVIQFEYCGFASQTVGEEPINYVVINTNRWIRWQELDPAAKRTRQHEHEHQKNRLFKAVFEGQLGSDGNRNLYWQYETEQDPEIKRALLEDYFRSRRAAALELAKDEITAYLSEGIMLRKSSLKRKFFQQDNPYDYLSYPRDVESKKEDALYQDTAQRMLVQEYKATIEEAVGALTELTKKEKYSSQEAVALLTDKPLSEWSKTVKRLLEQR
ncbi:hypothetical protein GF354_05895 [Candidatus Peregrinibacteria bacterium]|nr:hypothetical protein [Candidatus Peregrinibacteria bacterium]